MKEIKRLFAAYQKASDKSDRLDQVLETAINNGEDTEELTKQWDTAYQECFNAMESLINAVHKFSGIDRPTVRKMIHMGKFEALMNRI